MKKLNPNLSVELIQSTNKFLQEIHIPPQLIAKRIKRYLVKATQNKKLEIIVSGETDNISCYIINKSNLFVFTPNSPITTNLIIKNYYPITLVNQNICKLKLNKNLFSRFKLPKIVLINTYMPENYPIPRLSLGISIIGSYLRKYQKAEVYLLDTQLGENIDTIITKIQKIRPKVIGISIPHAQTKLSLEILERIYQVNKKLNSIIVAGNFIAASLPKIFFEKFPNLLICTGEGEPMLSDLCDHIKRGKPISEICNLMYQKDDKVTLTGRKFVDMDDLPIPALDTIKELKKYKGALTYEWSRGCFWHCTFCPREHKGLFWRGMSPDKIIERWEQFSQIINKYKLQNKIYLADEETVGGSSDDQTNRMLDLIEKLKAKSINIGFDSYARIDQIYNPKKDKGWHIKRMKMWQGLQDVGLRRLFVGVESGSKTQILRYGKGINPENSIFAIRMLSALNIDFRFGFIMFDPLMNIEEMIENIVFLNRKDAFLNIISPNHIDYRTLYDSIHDQEYINTNSLKIPLYARVSYMLASMETLINTPYSRLLKIQQTKINKKLIHEDIIDLSIGRYKTEFIDELIADTAQASQLWIDRNFAIM